MRGIDIECRVTSSSLVGLCCTLSLSRLIKVYITRPRDTYLLKCRISVLNGPHPRMLAPGLAAPQRWTEDSHPREGNSRPEDSLTFTSTFNKDRKGPTDLFLVWRIGVIVSKNVECREKERKECFLSYS